MKKRRLAKFVTAILIIFALVIEWLTIYELNAYERGVLDVYAEEQDGYVKITLDQINRLGDGATEENITDIIASLDATASKYWTLSTGDNILFIKSVTETNRYKNFTADTYYTEDSAKAFIEGLLENRVTHSLIELDDGWYVASGGLFSWENTTYRICLLTYDKVILERNALLEAKNAIIIFITITLALFLSYIILTNIRINNKNKKLMEKENNELLLNKRIEATDRALKRANAFDAGNNMFSHTVLPDFLRKLEKKGVYPIAVARFEFESKEEKIEFIKKMLLLFDRSTLRFDDGKKGVILLLAGYTEERCKELLNEADASFAGLKKWQFVEDNYVPYTNVFAEFLKEEDNDRI